MDKPKNHDDNVWDRLFDFTFGDVENMAREEIQGELRRLHVDLKPATRNIQEALKRTRETKEARASLKRAKETLPSVIARLSSVEVPSLSSCRAELERVIKEHLTGPQQAVYCRKLESAATDEDLKALLEDIARLKRLSGQTDDA